jgi:hypothetical protein
VTNVIINSTANGNYDNIPYEFDDVVGSEEQLRTVPVGAANQISVQITEDVVVDDNDLELIALNRLLTEPTPDLIQEPDATNEYTAIWSLSAPLQAAQYLLRLSDSIQDAEGKGLDGEWTNPGSLDSTVTTSVFPSGNGVAGGDFEFVFTILPGDMNRDNKVTFGDNSTYGVARSNPGSLDPEIVGLADINLDGDVDGDDDSEYQAVLTAPSYQKTLDDLVIVADMDGDFDVDDDDEDLFGTYVVQDDPRGDINKDGNADFGDLSPFAKYANFGIDLEVLV